MSHSDGQGASSEPSVADLEADIRRQRQELGETVEALSAKLDVKAQLKSSTDEAKSRATSAFSAHWQELAVVAVYAVLVRIAWKKIP